MANEDTQEPWFESIFGPSAASSMRSRKFSPWTARLPPEHPYSKTVLSLTTAEALRKHRGTLTLEAPDSAGIVSSLGDDPAFTLGLTRHANFSIRLNKYHTSDPAFADVFRGLAEELGLPPDGEQGKLSGCNLYIGGTQGAGLPVHYHRSAALAIQLEGSKTFTWKPGPIDNPTYQPIFREPHQAVALHAPWAYAEWDGVAQPTTPPPDDELKSVTLSAGECIFIPTGYWHGTAAAEKGSFSISFFFTFPRYGELLKTYVENIASYTEVLRAMTPPSGQLKKPEAIERLSIAREDLVRALRELDIATLANQFAGVDELELLPNEPLRRHPDARFEISGSKVAIHANDAIEGELPDAAVSVVKWVADSWQTFQLNELSSRFDDADATAEVVSWLLEIGALVRVPPLPKP